MAATSRPPLIGVTTSEIRRAERTDPLPEGEPPQHEMALGMPYVRALERAGGVPVVLPPVDAATHPRARSRRSRGSACRAGPTSIPPPTAPSAHPTSGRPSPASTRSSSRSCAAPTPPGCRSSASAAAARCSTSRAAARSTSTSRVDGRPPPDRPGLARPTHVVDIEPRLAAGRRSAARRELAGQLLPPPGGRPRSAAACARSAWAPDGIDRGASRATRRLRARRPVARRVARRPPSSSRSSARSSAAAAGAATRRARRPCAASPASCAPTAPPDATRSSGWHAALAPRGPDGDGIWTGDGARARPPAAGDHRPLASAARSRWSTASSG